LLIIPTPLDSFFQLFPDGYESLGSNRPKYLVLKGELRELEF